MSSRTADVHVDVGTLEGHSTKMSAVVDPKHQCGTEAAVCNCENYSWKKRGTKKGFVLVVC